MDNIVMGSNHFTLYWKLKMYDSKNDFFVKRKKKEKERKKKKNVLQTFANL